ALPDVASSAGVKNYQIADLRSVEAEWEAGRIAGARPIAIGSADYPELLSATSDAPPVLWMMGDIGLLKRRCIALIGARNASSLGLRMAKKLGHELGEAGFVVVSGMARGIDTAAHEASLATGSVAVFGGGVDVVYPAENAVLAQELGERGLRMSEQPMHTKPQARHFPRRNRIIAGLAEATVVVEAAAKSGSLGTARIALDQGREVLAVPGHPFDARAAGCNMLIRDGATLTRYAGDVIDALAKPQEAAPKTVTEIPAAPEVRPRETTQKLHKAILSRLGPSPTPEDQLMRDLKRSAGRVGPELTALEMAGKIRRHAGGMLSRSK
ncbi:MAG: DNA-processing protein DprA, partial [Pseudomonadota bacterium]